MRDESDNLNTGQANGRANDLPLQGDALARRRLLLKSLGKGTAVAAAASPLASFAAPALVPTTVDTQCTVSGFKSALVSRMPATTLPCGGFAPSYFVNLGASPAAAQNWPTINFPAPSGASQPSELQFRDLFGGNSPTATVLSILSTAPTSDQALFIAAFFTAALGGQVPKVVPGARSAVPFTTSDVVMQYANGSYSLAVLDFYRLVLVNS